MTKGYWQSAGSVLNLHKRANIRNLRIRFHISFLLPDISQSMDIGHANLIAKCAVDLADSV